MVVGTEPSCIAVWRSDALELLHDDPRVSAVAEKVVDGRLVHQPTLDFILDGVRDLGDACII